MVNALTKELCSHCQKCINTSQSVTECEKCSCIIHTKCYKYSKFKKVNDNEYCEPCSKLIHAKYNPYKFVECRDGDDDDDSDYDAGYLEMKKVSSVLEYCTPYTNNTFNQIEAKVFEKNISMYFLNIDGNQTNFDELIVEMHQYKHKFSVIGLAETNVDPSISNTYQIPGYYSFYQATQTGKKKGSGVALYIKDCFNATLDSNRSQITNNLETLFVTMSHESGPLTVGVAYRPPSGNPNEAVLELGAILEESCSKRVHCMGDFNIDLHNTNNKLLNNFENTITTSGFYPAISLYTHQKDANCRRTCIDNFLTNDIDNIQLSGTISGSMSQHLPIFIVLKLDVVKSDDKKHIQYYDYCNSNIDNFVEDLYSRTSKLAINDFSSFHKIFNDTLDDNCKLEKPKNSKRTFPNNPWITPGLVEACRRKHELKNDWNKSICKQNPCGNPLLEVKFKDYRRTLKHSIKLAKSRYYCKKFEEKSGDLKKTWEIINELRGKSRRQVKPQFLIDNVKVTNRRIIANEFNKYFVSIATKMNSDCIGLIGIAGLPDFQSYLPKSCSSSIYLHDCTSEEISRIISELQNGKSSDIPIKLIKQSSHVISPILEKLYNECMINGIFPDELKVGRISPIYKKDNEELMENYRPVSTLAVFGKIFEKIIYTRLYSFLLSKNIIYENQFGFRKGHSTSHALNYSVSHIESSLREKKHVIAIFIDLSKAFDTIDHSTLMKKLDNYGIRGNAHCLITSYLTNRKQYVNVLGEDSDKLPILFGVPQGSVLGPLLFLLYINDIYNATKLGSFVLFADDTNIFVVSNTKSKAYEKANIVLKIVNNYMLCNKLHINKKKCCYMYFSPSRNKNNTDIILDNNTDDVGESLLLNNYKIKQVSETKFLGVTIDDRLNWGPHIKNLVTKLRSCTGQIYRFKDSIPHELHKDIYHTLFESHLTFGISVWGGLSRNRLEPLFVVQKKCIRILFGDNDAYKEKFKTCARARPFDDQILGSDFYILESSKPLFTTYNILTVHNLYKYHCTLETYKILKLRVPISLYSLFVKSRRKETLLISQPQSTNFLCMSTKLWNVFRQELQIYDFSTVSIGSFKGRLKSILLQSQKAHDSDVWCELNYEGIK
jgi:hypothetical protein